MSLDVRPPYPREVRARVILIATLGAVVAAFLAVWLLPRGLYVAAAMMAAWAVLAVVMGREKGDKIAPARAPEHPATRIVHGLLLLGVLGAFAYSLILERQGRPRDVVQAWQDGAFILMLVGGVGAMAIEGLQHYLARRRQA